MAGKEVYPLLREEAVQFYRSTGTACIAHSHDDDRVYALRWRNERSQRMQLALIGGWAVKNIITPAKAYELLSEAGYSVKKFGSLTKNTRRYYGISSDSDYWRKLYLIEYGLAPKRRASYVETPLTDSIKTQIESIKALAADIVPAANETGVVYA